MSDSPAPSTIDYEVTEQDVAAFQRWAQRTSPRAWLPHLLILGIILPGVVLLGGLFNDWRITLLILALLGIISPIEQRKKMRQIWRDSGVVGRHSLEADEAGLVYRSVSGAARLDWRQVQEVVRRQDRAFFLIGPLTGVILPLGAFSDPAEAEAFLGLAESRRAAILAQPLPPLPPLDVPEGALGVEYALNEEDLRAVQMYPLSLAKPLFVIVGVLVIGAAAMTAYRWGLVWTLALLAAEEAIIIALALAFVRDNERLMADPSTTSPRTLVISPQGLVGRGAGAEEGQVAWTQVKKVDATADHLFLLWNQETAVGIPRRCFATGAEAEAFLSRAREWHQAVQPPPSGRKKPA